MRLNIGTILLLLALCTAGAVAQAPLLFGFDSAFGDNMLLQASPSKSAVYGFLDYAASMAGAVVHVTLTPVSGTPITVEATLNITYQTFGPDWGVRPCASCPDIDAPFNPFGGPLASWKALLPPQPAGGNFTVTAVCVGCTSSAPSTASISNVVFGDMWFCTGQSNMWLPVQHTYDRNDTANAILQGRYSNVRLMAGVSGNWVRGNPQKSTCNESAVWPCPYGGTNGSNAWLSAVQAAPEGCVDAGTCPLFTIGAACWYYAQALVEMGVTTPIGIADTAMGGQHIEEFMINHTISRCSATAASAKGHDFGPWGNGEILGSQIVPFVDMTIKGFVWYQGAYACRKAVNPQTTLMLPTCC